jgi:voltage-gated potassium channel
MFFELGEKPELTWSDAVWWSFVTMTTVGYGDFFPTTTGGRYVIGIPTMIFGISILGYLLSTVATYLIEAHSKEIKGMANYAIKDHILLIHFQSLNRIYEIVKELRSDPKTMNRAILLIDDQLEQIPAQLAEEKVRFVRGDPTKESTLEKANFREAAYAVILARDAQDPSSDNHTLAVTLTLEQLKPDLITVAECIDAERIDLMYKAGSDSVVCLARLSSRLVVQEVLDPGVQAVLGELTSTTFGQQIYMVAIEEMKQWCFEELVDFLAHKGQLALGVSRDGRVILNPKPDETIKRSDMAIYLGASRLDGVRIS